MVWWWGVVVQRCCAQQAASGRGTSVDDTAATLIKPRRSYRQTVPLRVMVFSDDGFICFAADLTPNGAYMALAAAGGLSSAVRQGVTSDWQLRLDERQLCGCHETCSAWAIDLEDPRAVDCGPRLVTSIGPPAAVGLRNPVSAPAAQLRRRGHRAL